MMGTLLEVRDAVALLATGKPCVVAASEEVLARLPRGNWVGGTIPYFMGPDGGVVTKDRVFVTELPTREVVFAHYGPDDLAQVVARAPDNGFTVAIVPAFSRAHHVFAEAAPTYPDAFVKPTIGWVAGVHLADLGAAVPKVWDGTTGRSHEDGMVVAHVRLPDTSLASIEIVNPFEPDDGDVLRFEETGFETSTVLVGGERKPFAAYLAERGNADLKLPLVGDVGGANINVSLQAVEPSGLVKLYAPVFPEVAYRLARPVPDYVAAFRGKLAGYTTDGVAFSCNCILNFLYGELEGRSIGALYGPVTFGEIGYQLLNQTLTLVRIT